MYKLCKFITGKDDRSLEEKKWAQTGAHKDNEQGKKIGE